MEMKANTVTHGTKEDGFPGRKPFRHLHPPTILRHFLQLLVSSLLCWEKARPRQARFIMRLTEVTEAVLSTSEILLSQQVVASSGQSTL